MAFPYYTGAADKGGPDSPVKLPGSRRAEQTAPQGFYEAGSRQVKFKGDWFTLLSELPRQISFRGPI